KHINASKPSPPHASRASVEAGGPTPDTPPDRVDPWEDAVPPPAVVPLTIVTVVRVRADVDAARTYGKIHSVRCGYRSRSQCDQRGEREDHSLHLALLSQVTEHSANDRSGN